MDDAISSQNEIAKRVKWFYGDKHRSESVPLLRNAVKAKLIVLYATNEIDRTTILLRSKRA
jgi:hypothetical protein